MRKPKGNEGLAQGQMFLLSGLFTCEPHPAPRSFRGADADELSGHTVLLVSVLVLGKKVSKESISFIHSSLMIHLSSHFSGQS